MTRIAGDALVQGEHGIGRTFEQLHENGRTIDQQPGYPLPLVAYLRHAQNVQHFGLVEPLARKAAVNDLQN